MKNRLLNTVKRGAIVGTVAVSAMALLLTGCGEAPPAPGGGSTENAAAANYLGCIVSDSGGFDDQSFNQSSYEGLQKTVKDLERVGKACGVFRVTIPGCRSSIES